MHGNQTGSLEKQEENWDTKREDKSTKEIHKRHITLKGKITNSFRLCLVSKKCQEKLFSHAWFDYEKYQE